MAAQGKAFAPCKSSLVSCALRKHASRNCTARSIRQLCPHRPILHATGRSILTNSAERRPVRYLENACPKAVASAADPASLSTAESSTSEIKAALLDSLYGIERGLSARSEVRAEINELISQLEALNPTPSVTEATERLDGSWKLVYTSNSELIALLALSRLPFVTIGDITQKVDTATMSVENKVQVSVPLSRTAFSTTASFEVRSPKRLQVKFERGTIQTPQLLSDIEVPESISVMGQAVDLTQLKAALQPFSERLRGLITQVSGLISQTPDLNFPLQPDRANTWLLTTYLDDDTRITRGDGGSVFILVKEVSLTAAVPVLATEGPAPPLDQSDLA